MFPRPVVPPLKALISHCNSPDMQRRMSSFAMCKPIQSVHDNYPSAASLASPDYYSDPRNIGRHLEAGFERYGMEMPKGVRDTIEAAREGDLHKGLDA